MHPFPLLAHLWASRPEDLGAPLLFQTTETPVVHRTLTLARPLTMMSICASTPAFFRPFSVVLLFSAPLGVRVPSLLWVSAPARSAGGELNLLSVGQPQTQRQISQVIACNGKYYGKNKRGVEHWGKGELYRIMLCDNLIS